MASMESRSAKSVDYTVLQTGDRLHAEYQGWYYAAEVVAVSAAKRRARAPVKVQFLGYSQDTCEWLSADRLRCKALRPSRTRDVVQNDVSQNRGGNDGASQIFASSVRRFLCPESIAAVCRASKAAETTLVGRRASKLLGTRAAVADALASESPVNLSLWILYRDFVDRRITGKAGRSEVFHRFACCQALALDIDATQDVTGGNTADIVACLAERGCLGAAAPDAAPEVSLLTWLEAVVLSYNNRFLMAKDRTYEGFTEEEEGDWDGDYDFIQLADPQLGMLHWDKGWSEEAAMLRLAVQHVNRLKPRFLLISGDLVNAFPSGPGAKPEVAAREIASFKEVLRELDQDISIILQPGNHDIAQTPLPEDVQAYIERFGDDYFSFWVGGVFYLSINSQYYMDAVHTQKLREDQDKWIVSELARAKGVAQHIVILSHVPPFVGQEEEPQGWATWELEPRRRILAAAADAGAKIWLSGHFHGNAATRTQHGMEIVVTSSCCSAINWTQDAAMAATVERPDFKAAVGSPPVVADAHHSGFRIVRVREHSFEHRFFSLADMPESLADAFEGEQIKIDRHSNLSGILGLDADPN